MRVASVLVVLLAISFAGCAGKAPTAPLSANNASTAAGEDRSAPCLEFVIVDEELLPIANANVSVDELDLIVPTDEAGQVEICDVPNGSFHVAVQAPGYDTARRTVTFPTVETIRISLRLLPVLVPYSEVLPKTVFHTVSLSTLDAAIGRYVSLNDVACSPCTFDFVTPKMPDFVYWEATWTRSAMVVPAEDQMYHLFRGGAPFENPPGETANRDIGSGSMIQPFQFQYHRNDLVRSPPVADAQKNGGEVAFSGAMYCWGNPPSPCVNQRIDVYLTIWYDILKVPDGYSALPPP